LQLGAAHRRRERETGFPAIREALDAPVPFQDLPRGPDPSRISMVSTSLSAAHQSSTS
jgi:hypothetical protein